MLYNDHKWMDFHSTRLIHFSAILLLFEDGWENRWVKSDWKKDENMVGDWNHTSGKWTGDPEDKGESL